MGIERMLGHFRVAARKSRYRHHQRHRPRCRSRRRRRLPYVPLPFGSISALARVGI